jgi:hypothetical protein
LDLIELYHEHQTFLNRDRATFEPKSFAPVSKGAKGVELVALDAVANGSAKPLRTQLEALGLQDAADYGRVVSGQLPISAIPAMARLSSLRFARPAIAVTNAGATTSQGDRAMRSDVVRLIQGFDGTGVTVGVMSDSYSCHRSAPRDVMSGDLPTGVKILQEGPCVRQPDEGLNAGEDEGRAMMQIAHDVAPGASLAFHTAFTGLANVARGILELGAAPSNAKVIADDVVDFHEPMFQDGLVAQAVDQVVANGVTYFSAAANLGRDSYESAFRAVRVDDDVVHNFDPGPQVDPMQSITIPSKTGAHFVLQWGQPFYSVSGAPGATTDLDIAIIGSDGQPLSGGVNPNIGNDPVEIALVQNNQARPLTANIVIKLTSGPPPSTLKYVAFTDMGQRSTSLPLTALPFGAMPTPLGWRRWEQRIICRPSHATRL